jgi:ribokinase
MRQRSRIAVVGSANVDLTTFADRFPRPGETIFGDRFELGWGGKGANQAVAARLCGADVCMVARVGDDLFGPGTIENLASQGIDTSHVRPVAGVSSGVAPIFVESSGRNRIFVIKGANDCLTPADIDAAAPMLSQVDCILLQFEIPLEVVAYAVRFARERGIQCIVNPAPAPARVPQPTAESATASAAASTAAPTEPARQPAPGHQIDLAAFAGVDYFIPNETEAESLTELSLGSIDDAKACATRLIERGLGGVIITLGERGALLARDGRRAELIPGYEVSVKDTTGAGDAFVGSFSAFLCEGFSERDAVERANLYAALSTMRAGTQKSFVTREQFDVEWQRRG